MVFKWIWSYISKKKYWLFLAFILVAICSALNMVVPYISGIIVDRVILKGEKQLLIKFSAAIIGVTLARSVLRYIFQFIFEAISQNAIFNIRLDLYSNLQKLDFDFYDKTRTGDIMARMTGDVDTVRHFITWVIYAIFDNILIFVFAMIMMVKINFKLTLIILLFTPPILYFTFKLSKSVKPTFFGIREAFSRLNSVVQENISGNRVVKAFAKEDYEILKFSKENENFKNKNIASSKVWGKYVPIIDSFSGLINVVAIFFGGVMVIQNSISLGELVTINSLIFAINNPLRMAGWIVNDTQRFATSAEKIMELMFRETKIKEGSIVKKQGKSIENIQFKNVCFSYENESILKNINLKIKSGETVGIIGPTGSGKTTLINLLCRFYDCDSGSISIDDVDIRKISIKELREKISVAMQDIFLFSDTIEGNIAYGVPDAPKEEIKWAAQMAGADDFISEFSEGYDTVVGERGVGLSGGQKQRIALARAIITDSPILILDDTTSAVDMETENKIQSELNKFANKKTTFIIAHRISSVKNADNIIVLNDGEIIEQGKHEELIKKNGYYYNVYMNQFGNFDNNKKEV